MLLGVKKDWSFCGREEVEKIVNLGWSGWAQSSFHSTASQCYFILATIIIRMAVSHDSMQVISWSNFCRFSQVFRLVYIHYLILFYVHIRRAKYDNTLCDS